MPSKTSNRVGLPHWFAMGKKSKGVCCIESNQLNRIIWIESIESNHLNKIIWIKSIESIESNHLNQLFRATWSCARRRRAARWAAAPRAPSSTGATACAIPSTARSPVTVTYRVGAVEDYCIHRNHRDNRDERRQDVVLLRAQRERAKSTAG